MNALLDAARKSLPWIVVGSCAVAFAGAPRAGEVVVKSSQSGCLALDDIVAEETDWISVEVVGCAIVVRHERVVTNCCLEYVTKVSVDGSSIELVELDEGPPCDCICPFGLEARIDGLESGHYTLTVRSFLHEPASFQVEIPPCDGFWIIGPQVWSPMGVAGVEVRVLATNDEPLDGFSFGTTFPLEHARLPEMNLEGTVAGDVGAELFAVDLYNGESAPGVADTGWGTCMAILDFEPPWEGQKIPAGAGQRLVNLIYDILPPSGSVPRSISVPFVGDVGKPPVPLVYSVGGRDIVPEAIHGIIQLTMPPEFIRGDVNDNSVLSVSDVIYLLGYLFRGGPEPPCDDAADANDDGSLDIADAVSVVLYLFGGAQLPPPSPPGPPGPDPTMDELGCARGA